MNVFAPDDGSTQLEKLIGIACMGRTRMRRSVVFSLVLLTGIFMDAGIASPAAKRPVTVAELPLYNGADRQQILEEGAKKEGTLLLYTSGIVNQSVRPVTDAFQKK